MRRRVLFAWAALPVLVALFWAGAFGLSAGVARAEEAASAETEFRALWVPRWGLIDPAWVRKMVADAEEAGFTALFVQVDGRGEAYYRSDILPPPEDGLPGVDPLAVLLEEAHGRGLAVHAWVNAYTVGLPNRKPTSEMHPLNRHPEWITHDAKGQSLLAWSPEAAKILPGYFLEPGHPEVQEFVVSVVRELVARYPVDGVHLDYIRYPGKGYGFHPLARSTFQASTGVDPLQLDQAKALAVLCARWDQWRRDQISALVRRVAVAVRATRPGTAVSAAVFAELSEAVDEKLQDWPAWLAAGDVDFVMLMAYTRDTAQVLRQLERARAAVPSGKIYPGLGVYKFTSAEGFLAQVRAVMHASPQGVAVYSYQSLLSQPEALSGLPTGPFAGGKSIQNPEQPAPAD